MTSIVVIGNFQSAYGPFDSTKEADSWADMAQYTALTDNGRTGTTVVTLREPAKAWAFKVRVEVVPEDTEQWFEEWFTVAAGGFHGAEVQAIEQAKAKYPGRVSYTAWDTQVRQ